MTLLLTRRGFATLIGAAGFAVPPLAAAFTAQAQPAPAFLPASGRSFLTAEEVAFLEAAVDRLIPPDETGPSATEAGVIDFLDRALAGDYGRGARLYTRGPWADGVEEQGYQLRYTPAELYRVAVTAAQEFLRRSQGGQLLQDLRPGLQDEFLRRMQGGELLLGDLPMAPFFELLSSDTIEGYLADPLYGGNRDMAAWRMIGFPGAYATYVELVAVHGIHYDRPPLSIGSRLAPHRR